MCSALVRHGESQKTSLSGGCYDFEIFQLQYVLFSFIFNLSIEMRLIKTGGSTDNGTCFPSGIFPLQRHDGVTDDSSSQKSGSQLRGIHLLVW